MKTIRPLGDNLLVAPLPPQRSIGGILLPDSVRDEANMGGSKLYLVLAVGPGRVTKKGVRVPVQAAPGDHVVCHSYTDGPKDIEDGTHRKIISERLVLAVIPKEPGS